MPAAREKGKIARSEWSKILARYRAGATIAQIGRDYGCTGPAIRYIVKRADALDDSGTEKTEIPPSNQPQSLLPSVAHDSIPPSARMARAAAPEDALAAELRDRVSGDVASFLVALDQLASEGSAASAAELREATDRLMRSAARIRLEVEKLLANDPAEPARTVRSRTLASFRRT
jgi:hypothetical protein